MKHFALMGLVLVFSCKKEKPAANSILVTGEWYQQKSFTGTGVVNITNGYFLEIKPNGVLKLGDNNGKVVEKGRFTRIVQLSENLTGQGSDYLFEVNIDKKSWFSTADLLSNCRFIWYNRYISSTGYVQVIELRHNQFSYTVGDQVFTQTDSL